jgi:aspartate 4-decarboxylase
VDGGRFGGPPWSVRLSMANLTEQDYQSIGRFMQEAAEEYVAAWKEGTKLPAKVAAAAV